LNGIDTIQNLGHAQEVGFALGFFHNLINDLPLHKLADTLKGFHITPFYLDHYDQVLAARSPKESPEVDFCLRFINRQGPRAGVLEKAKADGLLPLKPIHGDPKVNNVLIDTSTQKAVSLIDLDTVKPGLIHYDIGDCLRSCCNPLGEDTQQWEEVLFEPELCRAILEGYLPMAGKFLSNNDYAYLFEAVRLIAFELGLRFFTDYLEGNIYFKVGDEKQNLLRALVQFKLTESIESQAGVVRSLIEELR
jgi:Ser/Thr protein kinase RdoA (MazF antagonist)